ncbi:RNA polymerase II C-terminal domain phosphatase-like 3-like protein [Drosera capensis]
MGVDGNGKVNLVEEGDISTTKTTAAAGRDSGGGRGGERRYWMKDLYKYYPRGYTATRGYSAAGLYNLAWAQAVQNKPLNDVLVDLKPEEKTTGGGDGGSGSGGGDEAAEVDSEKEEGELEDGEIDFDGTESKESGAIGGFAIDLDDDAEFEKEVESIRQGLEKVTVAEAEKSFEIVCNRLIYALESLRHVVMHSWFPTKDALIQQAFAALQCVCSVYGSTSVEHQVQNKAALSRLLSHVLSVNPPFFTPDQTKEVEAVMISISPPTVAPENTASEMQEEIPITDKTIMTDSNTIAVNHGPNNHLDEADLGPDYEIADQRAGSSVTDALGPIRTSNSRPRFGVGPLLDLHKAYDEDSLPSPTEKSSVPQAFRTEDVARKPDSIPMGLSNGVDLAVHPYETDALRAVSSYQQKFAKSTFSSYNRLPSPTPSEEGNKGEADEAGEEVSSSSAPGSIKASAPYISAWPAISSFSIMSSPVAPAVAKNINSEIISSVSNPSLRAAPKSRDPRLRYMNPDVATGHLPVVSTSSSKLEPLAELLNSKKHKITEVPNVDVPAQKKQRNGPEIVQLPSFKKETESFPVSKGMGNSGLVRSEMVSGIQQATVTRDPRRSAMGYFGPGLGSPNAGVGLSTVAQPASTSTASTSLQTLLSNLTGNPAALMSLLRERKKSTDPATSLVHHPVSSSSPSIPPASGSGPVLSQAAVTEDSTKSRMKPRDPRRVLQNSVVQMTGNSAVEHSVTNEELMGTAQETSMTLRQPAVLPDITKPFTTSLKNIADIMSVAPTSVFSSVISQSPLPEGTKVSPDTALSDGMPSSIRQEAVSSSIEGSSTAQPQGMWGDVEHLFDGYDDQQKATIQEERARRIEQQKQMFSSKKLCLVLDLDHTLLNSAKFSEVDQVHDEMLRKKEEQDREKTHRHLFRFPHMGMWTKLRPGVWNFLEKASKLYEMHLYTMGNKLYATEMAKLLDPKGVLFSGRVISRGDDGDPFDGDERVHKSKDLDGVLGLESAVVIIDDSVRVWPHNKLNLIVVERYTYFPCSRRQFGLPGPSLLEIDHDERSEDGTLASSLQVIEKLHQSFFFNKSLDDVDVRSILAAEQRKILAGCKIVFSRVIPVGEANPHLHPLWQTAEQFGAVCTNQIDEQVTHVVANSLGTDKVNWALSTGRPVVHPGWVEASALLYRRANEQDFAIKS